MQNEEEIIVVRGNRDQIELQDYSECCTSKIVIEDEDEFRTPTSLDHKIPKTTKCPPTPMKTRPTLSTKRKTAVSRTLIFDEVDFETMFIAMIQEDLHRDNKIVKTEIISN